MQKGTSGDELRQWRMAPYVDAVLQQKRSRFLIRLSAQLLRWVTRRPRTHQAKTMPLCLRQQQADASSGVCIRPHGQVKMFSALALCCHVTMYVVHLVSQVYMRQGLQL